jgi:ribosomal protein L12E/L44/L45/RPP1/RPP2
MSGDMIIMSIQMYEEKLYMLDVYSKLEATEKQISEGKVIDADESLSCISEELMYRLVISELAHKDLHSIITYMKNILCAPEAATIFKEQVKQCYSHFKSRAQICIV